MHLAYIWIVSHLSAKNYRNWWKFDEVLTKTNLLSVFGTRCIIALGALFYYASARNNRWQKHYVCPSVRLSVVRPSVNIYFTRRDISLLSAGISMKLVTNIHRMSEKC